jgi:hypothetical protein
MGRGESRGRKARGQRLGNTSIARDGVTGTLGFAFICAFCFSLLGRAAAFDAAGGSGTRAFGFTFLGRAGPGSVHRRRPHVGLARTIGAAGAIDVRSGPGLGRSRRACAFYLALLGRTRPGGGVASDPVSSIVESSARARLGRTGRVVAAGSLGPGRAFRRRLGCALSGRRAAADRCSFLGPGSARVPIGGLGHPQDRRAGRTAGTVVERAGRAAGA